MRCGPVLYRFHFLHLLTLRSTVIFGRGIERASSALFRYILRENSHVGSDYLAWAAAGLRWRQCPCAVSRGGTPRSRGATLRSPKSASSGSPSEVWPLNSLSMDQRRRPRRRFGNPPGRSELTLALFMLSELNYFLSPPTDRGRPHSSSCQASWCAVAKVVGDSVDSWAPAVRKQGLLVVAWLGVHWKKRREVSSSRNCWSLVMST